MIYSMKSFLIVAIFALFPGFGMLCAQTAIESAPPSNTENAEADTTALMSLLQQAVVALNESRPAEARQHLRELLALNPEPWVHVYLAQSWRLEGKIDEVFAELDCAISAFEQAPYSASPLACDLDEQLAGEAWQAIQADPRFGPLLERAKKGAWRPGPLIFDDSTGSNAPRSQRPSIDADELKNLREAYALETIIAGSGSDLERVQKLCQWVHSRTSHDGWNEDLPKDALGLLRLAEKGGQWRCVEFGVVVTECLNAVGIPSRVVGGRARDVETIVAGAGHVFAEAWLEDQQRWVFIDAQLGLVAVDTDGTPLNSVEFRNALARPESPFSYPRSLALCMHFFHFKDLEGDRSLMIGPVDSAMPTKFQRQPVRAPDMFTHRLADAYAPPQPPASPRTVKITQADGTTREVPLPQSAEAWAQLAKADIEASYTILFNNHPGIVDPNNRSFPRLLAEARESSLKLVPRIDGPAAYMFSLLRFNATLQDGHAGPFPSLPQELEGSPRWPGFLVAWRGDGLWVHHSEVAAVPAGARILSVDGKPVEALIRERVFAYEPGLDQPGRWWLRGGRLLIDSGNPFLDPLRRCEIQTADRQRREVTLDWRSMPDSAYDLIGSVTNGDRLPIELQWHEERWPWIALPTFQPDESEVKAYDELVRAIEAQRERLLKAPAIVLDLRHNQGGSSQWSVRVASTLWGADRVQRRRNAWSAKSQTWWRASPENTSFVEALGDKIKELGMHELVPEIRRVGEGMRAALANGEPFFNQSGDKLVEPVPSREEAAKDLASDPLPLTVPVFVIVPPQCASAGLDAVDTFKLFPNTRLVGAPSSADSTYMEVRLQELPSGFGQIIVPNKVYIDRPRGNGEYYTPDVLHREFDWSTKRFLKLIQTEVGELK
jgi:hypothetical protein